MPARSASGKAGSDPGCRQQTTRARDLATGTRLGPYEIAALLCAGGMGEVYRARDTRLNRETPAAYKKPVQ